MTEPLNVILADWVDLPTDVKQPFHLAWPLNKRS